MPNHVGHKTSVSTMEVETWPPLVDGNLGLLGRESSPELNLALSAEDIPSDEERELLQSPITDENQTTCVKNALVNGGEYESEEEKLLHEASAISNCNGHRAGETVSDTASVFRTEKYCEVLRLTEFSDLISKSHHDKEEDISNGAICAATIDGENDHGEESIIRENDVNKKSSLCDPSEGVSGTDVIVENPCSLDVSDEQKLVKGSTEVLVESIAENKVSSVCREEDEDHLLESGLSPKSLKDFGDDLDDMEIPQVIDISSTCVDKETEDTPTAVEVCALDESAIAGEVEGNKVTGDKAEMATTSKDRETVEPNEDEKSITEHVDDLSIVSPKDISPSLAEDNEISASFGGEETENTVSAVAVDTPASGEDAVKLAKEDDDKLVTDSVEEVSVAGEDSTTDYGVEAMTVSGAEEVTVAGEDCTTDCGVEDSGGMAMLCAEDSNEAVSPVEEETMVDDSMDFDQEDGSADYQGMPDDILPIIESELDDMPVGEGNIFDTEVECGDGDTSMQEEAGDTNQETSSNSLTEIENDAASPQPARDQEECSSDSLFSLSPRVKLKRRGSADNVESPPTKVLKRQSSLNELTECAERSGTLSFDEFKKLSTKKLAGTQENIASEPLDIPIDIEMNQTERSPAKRRRMVDDEPKVGSSSSGAESVDQPVEKNVGTQDESLLVIDLDEDDDKTVTVEHPSQSQSPTKEQAGPGDNGPKSALDVLFNGKKEITLNRKMFTRVIKAHISQYLLTFSELGKATNLSLKANDVLNRIQSGISNYEKQKEDFKSIMTKLLEDRQAQKTWDETLVPPRATRSVGLQVCSVGSMYVKNGLDLDDASTSNKLTTSSSRNAVKSYSANSQSEALAQQKQAYAQQQMAMAQSRIKQAERQLNNIRPIAKKSVTPTNRPIAMKTVPVSKPVTPIIPKPQFPITAPKLNGLKAVTVTRNPEPSASPNSSPLTVTTVSPNSRTFTLSNKGTFALKSPLKPATPLTPQFKQTGSSMLSKALSTSPKTTVVTQKSQNSSRAVPIAVSHTPGTVQISKNLASGPGRPGKSPAPPVKKPSSAVSEDATIDLTEDDAPPPSKPSKDSSTARKSTAPSRVGVQAKVPMSNKQLRHPALPPNPHSFDVATAPPRPYLGICDTQTVTQGIMLTWHFNNVIPLRKISKFQVFAYQESKGDGEDAWKKVGDVDALPLPMACTLTQFREGYTYHFIVRALDEAGNVGLFSAPNTITLMKKTV